MSEITLLRELLYQSRRYLMTAVVEDDFVTVQKDWIKAVENALEEQVETPVVVCLCGSSRFKEAYEEANLSETLKGNIVLSVGGFMHADDDDTIRAHKEAVDKLHLRKIDMADEVFILNVGGYIGDSTAAEIVYAAGLDKKIRYLEDR